MYYQRDIPDNVKNAMTTAVEIIENVLVVQLEGQVNSANAAGLEADLMSHVDKSHHKIVLDLSKLNYISSAGLRVILMLAKRLKQAGGTMTMCNLQPDVREVFDISGFLAILSVHDTRADAIRSMS